MKAKKKMKAQDNINDSLFSFKKINKSISPPFSAPPLPTCFHPKTFLDHQTLTLSTDCVTSSPSCRCPPGYYESDCSKYNPCDVIGEGQELCQNGGTCHNTSTSSFWSVSRMSISAIKPYSQVPPLTLTLPPPPSPVHPPPPTPLHTHTYIFCFGDILRFYLV